MSFPYYSFLIITITLVFFLMYLFIQPKKNIPIKLFTEALRNENSGDIEAAIIKYENALNAVKNRRFRNRNFQNKIIEKLKLLQTVKEYNNGINIIKKDN